MRRFRRRASSLARVSASRVCGLELRDERRRSGRAPTARSARAVEAFLQIVDRHLLRDDAAERGELDDRLLHLRDRNAHRERGGALLAGGDRRTDDVAAEPPREVERVLRSAGDGVRVGHLDRERRADALRAVVRRRRLRALRLRRRGAVAAVRSGRGFGRVLARLSGSGCALALERLVSQRLRRGVRAGEAEHTGARRSRAPPARASRPWPRGVRAAGTPADGERAASPR